MKKTATSFLLLLLVAPAFGQIWTETFSNGCSSGCGASSYVGPNGAWTQTITGTEGSDPNTWFVSCAENNPGVGNCGTGCTTPGNQTLHIGANSQIAVDPGASYDAGGLCGIVSCPQTSRRIESPVIDLTGIFGTQLRFSYIETGAAPNDNATVWYFDGSTWSQLVDEPATNNSGCSGQGRWTSYNVALPASANNNANVKIGFQWVNNDDGVGTDPSFAVDDVIIEALTGMNTLAIEPLELTIGSADQNISIDVTGTTGKNELRLYDLSGRLVQQQEFSGSHTAFAKSVLGAGCYVVQLRSEDGRVVQKKLVVAE